MHMLKVPEFTRATAPAAPAVKSQYQVGDSVMRQTDRNLPESKDAVRDHRALGAIEANPHDTFINAAASVEAILHRMDDLSALDPWIDRIDHLLQSRPELFASPLIDRLAYLMFAALNMRRPDHPRIDEWKDRVMSVFERHDDPNLRILCGLSLFAGGHLSGNRGGLHHFFQMLRQWSATEGVGPLARIAERLVTVWYLSYKGAPADCLAAFEEGLALATRSGIHQWNGFLFLYAVTAVLGQGDVRTADTLLVRMEERLDTMTPMDRVYFHHLRGWNALLEHDLGRALFHQSRSLAKAKELGLRNRIEGTCHFGLAVILHEKEESDAAREHLKLCREIGLRIGNRDLGYLCDLTEAHIALDAGARETAAQFLRSALKTGREVGFFKFTYWRDDVMARLCSFALREGIAVDFVRQMIRHFDLFPPTPPWDIENWPWLVEVRTLGGFALRVDGQDVVFSAKAPKKSLELLKALSAFGPTLSEASAADLLWPQADGDAAIGSLEITLHRLRKLLGDGSLVRRTEGKLLLDRRRVFVDLWALEALLEEVGDGLDGAVERLAERCRLLTSLYRGAFLPGEDDLGWTLPMRRKLAQRYLQEVVALGNRCEALGHWGGSRRALSTGAGARPTGRHPVPAGDLLLPAARASQPGARSLPAIRHAPRRHGTHSGQRNHSPHPTSAGAIPLSCESETPPPSSLFSTASIRMKKSSSHG